MLKHPNIIIIQTDQLSACSLGLYGNPVVKTPSLEKLAESGVLFKYAFCNYPACVPSRASMLTGRYAHTIRSHANFIHLHPDERTIVHVLKDNGYQTALIGKNHAFTDGGDHAFFPGVHGREDIKTDALHTAFDHVQEAFHGHRVEGWEHDPEVKQAHEWAIKHCWKAPLAYGTNPYSYKKCGSYLLGEATIDYLRHRRDKDKPFFLWLSYPDPHTPYQAPEPYASMYNPDTIPLPPKDTLENKPERQKVAHLMDAMDMADDDLIKKIRAIHYGMTNAVDDSIGRVLKELEAQNLKESTIIVFTSDHGDSMGAHGLIQKHNAFYDTITQVPLIISWPSHIEPQVTDELAELVDIVPTLLDLAGLQSPFGVQGRSLKQFLEKDSRYTPKEFVVVESGEHGEPMKVSDITVRPENPFDERYFVWCAYRDAWYGKGKSIRTHQWKLNVYDNGDVELYNLLTDPDELINLGYNKEYAEIIHELEGKLLRWSIDNEDRIPDNTTIKLNYEKYKSNKNKDEQ
ncbi:MAG TPA: sulfatase-like hydrolase/transferase [Clostridiaceae bacterium]|nr:sulfatase-like hydrolase/transferase [Clostridiaceae bacterium]